MLKQKFQRKNRLKLLFQHLLLGENKFSRKWNKSFNGWNFLKQKFQRYKLAETKVPAYNPDRSTL